MSPTVFLKRTAVWMLAVSGLLMARGALAQAALTPDQIYQQLDPQMARVVTLYNNIKGTPPTGLSPQDARQQFSVQDAGKIIERGAHIAEQPMQVGSVVDGIVIDEPDGGRIPVRIYVPAGKGPFPVTVYYHGGGFVIATINTYDASARELCNYAQSIIVSVEYRKAPEARFPAARTDAIAAYRWTIEHIAQFNGNPGKVAVAGESAGGNLATEVAMAARDQNFQRPTHELLVYPVVSNNVSQPSDLLYTDPVLPLTTAGLLYFFQNYVYDPSQGNDPQVSPLYGDLSNLPPTTIIAAELDPLASDGQAYAAKLAQQGNQVQYRMYPGTTHEFFGLGGVVNKATDAEQYAGARLAASFQ